MNILVDIGGTKTRIAASTDATFGEPIIIPSQQSYDEALDEMTRVSRELLKGGTPHKVIVGMTGVIRDHRVCESAPHLPNWKRHDLGGDLSERLQCEVWVENDAALVGLGEAHFGAGRGVSIFAYITISTGVGGVRITDGRIDRSAYGFEIGGSYLSFDPPQTFEDLVSGTAVSQREGKHPRDLGADWEGWEELAKIAAFGVSNAVAHWSPEKVAIGGSMMKEIGISIDSIRTHVRAIAAKYETLPSIVKAELGDLGGLWGGIALLGSQR